MKKYGLIGFPLTHSFSKSYFSEKFRREGITDCQYDLYELPEIQSFPALLVKEPELVGLNVTIPYKQQVIPYLDRLDPACKEIGAVNCIKITPLELIGYNTDYFGFKTSLSNWIGEERPGALILGTGGASRAVAQALKDLHMPFLRISRSPRPDSKTTRTYDALAASPQLVQSYPLIINTTPVGTYPHTADLPPIPVSLFGPDQWYYDLVYNPEETRLMQEAAKRGAKTKNGLEMLHLQAEAAWDIWNEGN